MSPGLPAPPMPMPFSPIHRGPGGGGGMGFRPGGGDPGMGLGNEVAIPMFAKGNVVDHPQLALIGEAGPEVVMPLTRPAAHPGIRKMQDQLGLPATPMATGGAAGLGGSMLNYLPAQVPSQRVLPSPRPGGNQSPGQFGNNALQRKPAQMSQPGSFSLTQLPAQMPGKDFAGGMPGGGGNYVPDSLQFQPMPFPGGKSFPGAMPSPGGMPGGGGEQFSVSYGPAPAGPASAPPGSWQPQQNGMPGKDFPGAMPGQPPSPSPPSSPFGPTSAMDVFRSAVPVMNDQMTQQIQNAASQGGMTGNRFGTSTERNFMDIGRQAGNQMNQLMGNLLYDQTNQDLNRSLQATGMGLEDARFRNQLGFQGEQNALDRAMQAADLGGQFGQMQDQMMQDRLRLPFQIGAWEQGRQDQYARMPYDDFMQSRMGYLPYLFDLMASQGGSGGMSPQFGVQQTGGSPGALDYISALAPIFFGMMAEGGAAGSGASRYLEGGY